MLPSRLCWKTPQTGPGPLSSALARRLNVPRQTLYRDFPDQITRLQTEAACSATQPRARNTDKDQQTIARLRAEKENLTRHLYIYEDHIRRLTLENEALRVAQQAHSGVTLISPRTGDTVPGRP